MISENEEIEDDFYQEIELCLDDILGLNAFSDQKEDLKNSLLTIFRKRCKEALINSQVENDISKKSLFNSNNSMFNIDKPCINLIIPYNSISNAYPQPFGNIQSPMNQLNYNIPYCLNSPNYQMFQQQQFYQQPYTAYINQPFVTPNAFIPNSHNNRNETKVKSKKNRKKSTKSTEKHQSKKSKKKDHSKSYSKKTKSGILEFKHKEGDDFNGIFKYLTNKTSGNIHDNGTIEVTSNSINPIDAPTNHPKNLLNDIKSQGYLSDSKISKIWIMFDFKDMELELSSYTFHISGSINPIKNWEVEISNDKSNWTQIDNHINDSSLCDFEVDKTFNVQPNRFAKYVRFSFNITKVSYGNYAISIKSIEFYGKLKI